MITKHQHKDLMWIDIEQPTHNDIAEIMEQYSIHPLIADELLHPTIRPKVDLYDEIIYLVLHFPASIHANSEPEEQEIDFILGKDFLITVRYGTVDSLHEFSKIFEVNSILDKSNIGDHAGFLFFYMIRNLYRNLGQELDFINNDLKSVEKKVFEGHEKRMVQEMSHINRRLLDFKQAIRFHSDVLQSFKTAASEVYGKSFKYYLDSMDSEYYKVLNMLQGHKEILDDLRSTNEALLTTKTNEVIKILTLITFTTLPITLTTGILGMNIPIGFLSNPNSLWTILFTTVGIGIIVFYYFNKKGWL